MAKHALNDSVQVDSPETPRSIRIPWWVSSIVILGAMLTASGAVISRVMPTMLTNGSAMTPAASVYADYTFARNLPLAIMLLLLLALKARRMLAGFMVLTALIQMVDVVNDLLRGAFLLVPGLLIFAIAFFIGAQKLFGQPIWRTQAWREVNE